MKMKNKKSLLALLLAVVMLFALVACGGSGDETTTTESTTESTSAEVTEKINVAAISGPTGMGMVDMMDDEKYSFKLTSDPTEIVSLISTKAADIAACPLNLAANLYKKTEGGIKILGLNTLGVLYFVTNGAELNAVTDLKGKTVYATGQGTTVEYILNYILEGNGLKVGVDVTVEYLSEHSELVAKMTKGEVEYGVLPQPFVTVATAQNPDLKISLSLTDEWNKISPDTKLSMGCVIARTEFIEENPEAVKSFIAENKASVEFVNTNIDAAAELVVKYGIIGKAPIAKKAIPECNIVFIDGEEMKTIAAANYQVYFNADPTSIGGAVPGDDIYYVAE